MEVYQSQLCANVHTFISSACWGPPWTAYFSSARNVMSTVRSGRFKLLNCSHKHRRVHVYCCAKNECQIVCGAGDAVQQCEQDERKSKPLQLMGRGGPRRFAKVENCFRKQFTHNKYNEALGRPTAMLFQTHFSIFTQFCQTNLVPSGCLHSRGFEDELQCTDLNIEAGISVVSHQ
jgi:hypothetical protein